VIISSRNKVRNVVEKNIALCFPNLNNYYQTHFIKNSIRQLGVTAGEFPTILFTKSSKLLTNIRVIYGEDDFFARYRQKRGMMVLGPHLGCWEIGSMYYPSNFVTSMLYTPPKIEALDRLLYRSRSRICSFMSPANYKGVKVLLRFISKKKIIAMLTDQVPREDISSRIKFFGIAAKNITLPLKIYKRFKPAVVISYAVRNGFSKGLSLYIENLERDITQHIGNKSIEDPVAYACNQRYEFIIRKFPTQYQWSYKRFKDRSNTSDLYRKK